MRNDIATEALNLYKAESDKAIGCVVEGDPTEETYTQSVQWFESGEPIAAPITWEQLETYATQAESNREATAYRAKRVREYPSIGDQLDALYKAGAFPADMAATIQAVKDKYPKP